MRATRGFAAAAGFWACAIAAGGVEAQQALPAEFPPPSFTGTQYVDSQGCAFIRAGISGSTTYVPRLSRDRQPLCGFTPTFSASERATAVAAAPRAPNPLDTPVPGLAAPPLVAMADAAPPAAPAAPVPRRATAVPAPAPAVVAQASPPAPLGGSPAVATAAPSVMPSPATARMTVAEACAQSARTGARFVNAATGQPIACHSQVGLPILAGMPGARPANVPPTARPGALVVPALAAVGATRAAASPGMASLPSIDPSIPASNPVGLVRQMSSPMPGYERTWSDGRVNPRRGVPQPVSGPVLTGVPIAAAAQPRVVARAPAQGGLYVQVGAFGEPANADRALTTLAAAGLPVGVARSGGLQSVAAGPFASRGEAEAALDRARGAGYGDAFIR